MVYAKIRTRRSPTLSAGKDSETVSLARRSPAQQSKDTPLSLDGETMLITLLLVFSASNLTVLLVNLILLQTL